MQRHDQLWYHAIWATKNRELILDASHFNRIFEICKEREEEWQFYLDSVNGYLDHVHILIQIHPSQPVAKVIGWIKGATSHAFGEGFEWQSGYCISTVSPSQLQQIREYILNQPELHNKKLTKDNKTGPFTPPRKASLNCSGSFTLYRIVSLKAHVMKTTTTFTMVSYLLRCLNRIVLKHAIALSVLLPITISGFSQNISEGPTSTQAKHTGFSFSVFAGGSMSGPKQKIKSAMISSGLNDAPQNYFHRSSANGYFSSFIISFWESLLGPQSSGTSGLAPTPAMKQDPTTKQYGVFDIDLTSYFAKHHGVSLNLASANNQVVEGYQALGFGYLGNYISIHSKITSLSTNYVLCTSDQRHNISLGPSCIIHTILEQGPNSTNTAKSSSYHRTQKKKFGIFMGYSFMAVQKRNWFIGFKANYRWIPSSVIGPYQHKVSAQTNKTTVSLTSEFPSTKVGLSNINIGVIIGLRSSN